MTALQLDLYYLAVVAISIFCSIIVMWHKIPTGISGTVGFTMIALVTFGIASDWLDSRLPWIGVKRSLVLWGGLLFVIYWLLHKPWQRWERRIQRPHHDRAEDQPARRHDDLQHATRSWAQQIVDDDQDLPGALPPDHLPDQERRKN